MSKHMIFVVVFMSLSAAASDQDWSQDREATFQAAKHAYELAENSSSAEASEVAQATFDYGSALLNMYQMEESRKILKLALRRYAIAYGKDSPKQVDVLLLLAQADFALRRIRSSKSRLEKARELVAEAFNNESVNYANRMFRIGRIALALAFKDIAYEDLTTAHQVYVSRLGPTSIRLGESNHWLGKLYLADGRTDEAEPYFQAALNIFDSSNPELLERHILVRADWGGELQKLGLSDEASVHFLAVGRLQEPLTTDLLPLIRAAPMYPMDALKEGISGFVEWRYTVDDRGFVVDPQVIRLEGAKSFEKASLDALMRFRYPPRFVDGEPVATTGVTNTITFMLED